MKRLIQFIRLMAVPAVFLLFSYSALYGQIVSPVPDSAQDAFYEIRKKLKSRGDES